MTMRDRFWIGAFAAFFLLLALIRPIYGPALELDEAEAFWFSQQLAPGYGAQPPLYFWLQWGFLGLFGPSLYALSALKYLLLGATVIGLFRFLRPALPVLAAAAAAMSLGLVIEISWESQRALTHSVLVLALSMLAISAFFRANRSGAWSGHLWLGVVLGLGFLAKFNFVFVVLGLALAVLFDRGLNKSGKPARLILSVLIGIAMTLPYLYWAWQNPDLATTSLHKLNINQDGPIAARISGLATLAEALVSLLALPILALGWLGWRNRAALSSLHPRLRLMWVAPLMALGAILATVLLFGMGEMRSRWIMPILWPVVPVMVALCWPALAPSRQKLVTAAMALVWVLMSAGLLATSHMTYRHADFSALLAEIPPDQAVVSDNLWVLGNLTYLQPDRDLRLLGSDPLPPTGTSAVLVTPGNLNQIAKAAELPRDNPAKVTPIPGGRRFDQVSWYSFVTR